MLKTMERVEPQMTIGALTAYLMSGARDRREILSTMKSPLRTEEDRFREARNVIRDYLLSVEPDPLSIFEGKERLAESARTNSGEAARIGRNAKALEAFLEFYREPVTPGLVLGPFRR